MLSLGIKRKEIKKMIITVCKTILMVVLTFVVVVTAVDWFIRLLFGSTLEDFVEGIAWEIDDLIHKRHK